MTQLGPETVRPISADLKRWVEAEIISADQAERITSFELQRAATERSGRATRAVALLGALTLVSGVGSLIAYNWARLGGATKLAGLGVLLVLSVAWCFRSMQQKRGPVSVALDVGIVATAGLTLAGLALVSQVYDQDGALWQLMFLWCALISPLFVYSRTRFAHYFWVGALFVSMTTSVEAFANFVRGALRFGDDESAFAVLIIFGTLTGLLAARFAASQFAGRRAVGLTVYQVLLVAIGLLGSLFWLYDEQETKLLWLLGGIAAASWAVATPPAVVSLGWGQRTQVMGLLGLGLFLAVVPMGLGPETGLGAFLGFMIFWGLAWYLAERAHSKQNARFAVGVIGIRVVIASFELFESLLLTGSVLVAMGVAALLWSRFKWSAAVDGGAPDD